jgi:hypothetical protein
LTLPPDDFASRFGALVEDQAAEWDYQFKANAQCVQQLADAVSGASYGLVGTRSARRD